MELASSLKAIFELEVNLGNALKRIDEPAGTESPFGIVFRQPLHVEAIRGLQLSESVYYWESEDPHYELESGYAYKLTKHLLSGPLK